MSLRLLQIVLFLLMSTLSSAGSFASTAPDPVFERNFKACMAHPAAEPIRCAIASWKTAGLDPQSASVSVTVIPDLAIKATENSHTSASECKACANSGSNGLVCQTCIECWEDELLSMSVCGEIRIWCNQSEASCYPE